MNLVTLFGVCALTFMMLTYSFEHRHPGFLLGFVLGCLLSSAYGYLSGAWPFGVVEAVWGIVAFRRFHATRGRRT